MMQNPPIGWLPSPVPPPEPPRYKEVETKPKEATLSPADGTIPVVYGRRKVEGKFVYLKVINNYLHAIFIFCEGEIEGYEAILIDGDDIRNLSGFYYELYKGTSTQTVCSLRSYDSSWNDPLTNIAYAYIKIPTRDSFPSVEAIIKGRKVYDPRSAQIKYSENPVLILADLLTNTRFGGRIPSSLLNWGTSQSHPFGTIWDAADYADQQDFNITQYRGYKGVKFYSNVTRQNNTDKLKAIYILSEKSSISIDKLTFTPYVDYYQAYLGTGTPPSWEGWNDSLIGKTCVYIEKSYSIYTQYFGNIEDRYRINITALIKEAMGRYSCSFYFDSGTLRDAIDTVRRHFAGCVLIEQNGTYSIKYMRPSLTLTSFNDSEVWNVQIIEQNSENLHNRITWTWTDPETWEIVNEEIEDPNLTDNDEVYEGHYDLSGFTSYGQSKKLAILYLNLRLSNVTIQFSTYNSKGLQPLDVFNFTHQIGFLEKLFFVTAIQQNSDGVVTITANEYDPAFFDNNVISEPTYEDTYLPPPDSIPDDITDLTLTEKLEQLKDATLITNIKISWNESPWPYKKTYRVYMKEGSGEWKLLGITHGLEYEVRAVKELQTYTIQIVTESEFGKLSLGVSGTIMPQGKYLKPQWKQGASLGAIESGDIVFLNWAMPDNSAPAIDIDIVGYEIRRGRTTDIWDTAYFVIRIDSLNYQDARCPAGTWRYFLKAIDSVGNYTDTALSADVTVTKNPYLGFEEDRYFDLATAVGTNIGIWSGETITPIDPSYDTLGERFPGPTLGDGVGGQYTYLNLPAPSSASATTDVIDIGQILSGRFTLNYNATKIGTNMASVTPYLLVSKDNLNWTEINASSAIQAEARFIKAKFVFSSSSPDTTYIVSEDCFVNIQLKPIKESGTANVGAGGSIAITFLETFAFIKTIQLTPRGSSAIIATADDLTLTGFTLRTFNTSGNPVSATVDWLVEGY
jgi:hypothetical protein